MFESNSENKLAILKLSNESFVIHCGSTQFKPKVLYLFFTENIISILFV